MVTLWMPFILDPSPSSNSRVEMGINRVKDRNEPLWSFIVFLLRPGWVYAKSKPWQCLFSLFGLQTQNQDDVVVAMKKKSKCQFH